ncbi:ATP synthase F(1) complex subunit delta, mitochondrial-like [Styela clava]|uniref:ATP synthase subunit delta, mitochondrial-like n=1 Tax=Styela clava TaxID=7725 RepID=UPI00193A93AD|nr:ATP synthase subunit delta, mitochondrial-like [Styela clava]
MASLAARVFCRTGLVARRLVAQSTRTYADAAPAVAQSEDMVFTFASPVEAFYNESTDVKQADVPTGAGVIGILAKHVPIFGVLKPGVLTVFEKDGKSNKFFVSSGSFTVNEDSTVQIAAEEAVALDQLDVNAAKTNLTKAQAELSSATTDIEKAEAQVAIDCNEAIISAAS